MQTLTDWLASWCQKQDDTGNWFKGWIALWTSIEILLKTTILLINHTLNKEKENAVKLTNAII